jgi:hypothetical protein
MRFSVPVRKLSNLEGFVEVEAEVGEDDPEFLPAVAVLELSQQVAGQLVLQRPLYTTTIPSLVFPILIFLAGSPGLGIRIRRIRMFLGLSDPDPLVRGTDPDPDPAPDPSLFS